MKREDVVGRLIEALREVQKTTGHADGDAINPNTVPLKDLEGFDSLLEPAVLAMLEKLLGISIPKKPRVFVSLDGKQLLSIEGIADAILRIIGG
jgi:hypothetical protein